MASTKIKYLIRADYVGISMSEYVDNRFSYLFDSRSEKPRESGITFVIGDAVTPGGVNALKDMMKFSGKWVDWYKFVYSSIPFQPPECVEKKLDILHQNNVQAFPGGNFLESAVYQDVETRFLEDIHDIGCDRIEVSTTVVEMELDEKADLIQQASKMGFRVHSEVGKKPSEGSSLQSAERMTEEMQSDLTAGADKVIFESEVVEELLNVDTLDQGTEYQEVTELRTIVEAVGKDSIVFELPLVSDYQLTKISAWFIHQFGPNVNLGNVIPVHANLIEQQRRGIGPYTTAESSLHEDTQ